MMVIIGNLGSISVASEKKTILIENVCCFDMDLYFRAYKHTLACKSYIVNDSARYLFSFERSQSDI